MTTAAIYTRVSSDHGKEGMSVAEQEVLCRKLAADHGLTVVATFTDDDVGASEYTSSSKIREGYPRMLAAAKAGNFRFIVAYSASRLTRRTAELEDFVTLAKPPYGVRVVTKVSGDDDLTTADGLMTARLKSVIDAAESHRISERTRAKNSQRAADGKVGHSPWRAFGFEDDGKTHREREADLIREAIELIKGGTALKEIGRLWESRNVVGPMGWTKVARTDWSHSDVKDVLFRWKNVGVRTYKGEVMKDADGNYTPVEWEAIYSVEDRVAALEMIETHYKVQERRPSKSLLSGVLVCGICWRGLYANKGYGGRGPMYICTDGRKAHLGIAAGPLELYIQRVVFRYVLERAHFGEVEPPPILLFDGEERLTVVSKKLKETLAAYNENELDGSIAIPMLNEFRKEQKELTSERTKHYALQAPKPRPFTDRPHAMKFYREWREAPLEERRKLIRTELKQVTIKPGIQGKRAQAQLLERVKIEWIQPHPIFDGRSAEDAVNEPFTEFFARNFPKEPQPSTDEQLPKEPTSAKKRTRKDDRVAGESKETA
jgi:site-specific DNA recombinase